MEFLDYGGRERVLISSVRALPSNFVDLPFQGIRSSLKGEAILNIVYESVRSLLVRQLDNAIALLVFHYLF